MKRRYGLSPDNLFRTDRLLFTELLVAIERSHRRPTHEQLAFLTDQALFICDRYRTRPKNPPGVPNWLGHSDGGSLAMKTYGHLCHLHSQAHSPNVSF